MRNHDHHHHSPDRRREDPRDRRRGRRGPGPDWSLGGPPPFGADPFTDGPGRRGRRQRGGDVRAAVLLLLDEQPRHGYDLITEIGTRSDGSWTPSPGSIYPVLQQLEDEGLIEIEKVDGRKTASLTETGRAHVEEHRARLGTPWEVRGGRPQAARELRESLGSFMAAWQQVVRTGDAAQHQRTIAVVDDARKALYRVLADDDA